MAFDPSDTRPPQDANDASAGDVPDAVLLQTLLGLVEDLTGMCRRLAAQHDELISRIDALERERDDRDAGLR